MKRSKLVQLLKEGRPAIGCWITLTDPGIGIILHNAGVDWVMVDTEHHPFTEADVQGIIQALRPTETSCVVRVRGNDPAHIKWVLDTGADGIIVPMLESAEDAQLAVKAAKYHPLGGRGYGPLRATQFWADKQAYDVNANEQILLICMIEHPGAVRDIDRIAQMPGIDGLWIGPDDLSHAMGHLGNAKHPDVKLAISQVIDAANQHGKPWGIPVGDMETLVHYVNRGGLIMTVGSSSNLLSQAATEKVAGARQSIADCVAACEAIRGKDGETL